VARELIFTAAPLHRQKNVARHSIGARQPLPALIPAHFRAGN
jgi:hypothetical protein